MSKSFKVFTSLLMHETNSFCVVRADLERFKSTAGYHLGDEIPPLYKGTRSELGAIFDLAEEYGWELTHTLAAHTSPSGAVTKEAFEHFSEIILAGLRAALPVNGVILVQHGGMVVDHLEDAEGELTRRVREVVGPSVPVAVSLDLHCNIAPLLAESANIVSIYEKTPHTDMYETAERAGRMLQRTMKGEIQPAVAYAQRALFYALDAGRTISGYGPAVEIHQKAKAILAKDPKLLDIAVGVGFDWSDKKTLGPSVLVTHDGHADAAQTVADQLIEFAWETRKVKTIELLSIEKAIEIAKQPRDGKGPLLIGDYTDCPGGGGNGDGTALLAAMIEARLEDAAFGSIADAKSAEKVIAAGVGATVDLQLGGKFDPRFGGKPLSVTAKVLRVSDGDVIRKGDYGKGTATSFGPSALVDINGVKVIIGSWRVQIDDREQFRIYGIDPETTNILACKAMNHFRADYEPICRKLIYVETGGVVSFNYKDLPYKNVRRPIWPLDDIATSRG